MPLAHIRIVSSFYDFFHYAWSVLFALLFIYLSTSFVIDRYHSHALGVSAYADRAEKFGKFD